MKDFPDQAGGRRLARGCLVGGCLAALALLAARRPWTRISSDLLDLIPASESAPELTLIRELAGDRQSRVVLIAVEGPEGGLAAAAAAAAQELEGSGAFEEAAVLEDGAFASVGRAILDRRLELFAPGWLQAARVEYGRGGGGAPFGPWLAERTAARLEAFLGTPEALGFQDLIDRDPLLLVPDLAGRLQGMAGLQGRPAPGRRLIWALARGDALAKPTQLAVDAALARAAAAAGRAAPGARLRWTGVMRLAEQSRAEIEAEISRLNLLSLAAACLVTCACVRQPLRALQLAPVLAIAMLGAWTAVMLVFPQVHALVFVIGSLLCGVAIDYGFYIFLQPPHYPDEPYGRKLRRLLRPLLSSSLTMVLGFLLLAASGLPLIRESGVFIGAGLIAALGAAIAWFAQLRRPFLETRPFARARLRPGAPAPRWAALGALGLGGAVALIGPWRLAWRDDVRDLQIPAPALEANDRDLRALFGDSRARTVYLTEGATPAQAREALQQFLDWHGRRYPGVAVASVAALLPRPEDWRPGAAAAGLDGFEAELRSALARHHFDPDAFAPFFADFARWRSGPAQDYDALVRGFAAQLSGPAGLAIGCQPSASWFASIAAEPEAADPPPELATVSTRELESLNRLFVRYRHSALRLSLFGLALVGLSVLAIYGPLRGLAIFAVPGGSCLFAFGVLGLLGHPINLFHLLGAFLGVCLAHNYAIFTWENAASGEVPPPSIRLSAACTIASFGILGTSAIPVLSALGSTVALVVAAALAAVELAPLVWRGRLADPPGRA